MAAARLAVLWQGSRPFQTIQAEKCTVGITRTIDKVHQVRSENRREFESVA
jgi:hypothetical protein